MCRHVLILLLSVAFSACATSPKPAAISPMPQSTPVPRSEVFALDSGFLTGKQAASEFMQTLFIAKHDLLRDETFKRQFLSARLRQQIAIALQNYEKHLPSAYVEAPLPAAPNAANGDIFAAWDLPTSYTMTSGHETDDSGVYDVVYHWGPDTEYPGDTRVTSIILKREGSRWYVDDLYTHAGEFTRAQSFYESLVRHE